MTEDAMARRLWSRPGEIGDLALTIDNSRLDTRNSWAGSGSAQRAAATVQQIQRRMPPVAMLATEDRVRNVECRKGFSTKKYDAIEIRRENPPNQRFRVTVGAPQYCAAITKTGQCHRYNEYDQRPIHLNGSNPKIISGP
jgi:hypothetical protein